MSLESATYISELSASNPLAGDNVDQGDDHIRLLKSTLQNTFPNASKPFRFPTVLTKTGNYTVLNTDDNSIIVGNAAGTITFTLPTLAAGDAGWAIWVHNAHATGTVSIAPPSGTISGDSTVELSRRYANVRIMWTGSAYIQTQDQLVRSLKNVTENRLLGRVSTAGQFQELSLGAGLAFSGTTIVATIAPPFPPQGRLTPQSNKPIPTSNQNGATVIYYTPYLGTQVPIHAGSGTWEMFSIAQLALDISHASYSANKIFDVYLFEDPDVADTIRIGSGPVWDTLTLGSCARGAGQEIVRTNGLWTNSGSITVRNGATTYTVAATRGTLVGTIRIGPTDNQVPCHSSYGASRHWGVTNAYNRVTTVLKMGKTSDWTYGSATIRQADADTTLNAIVVCGLEDEFVKITHKALARATTGTTAYAKVGIGVNSTTVMSGLAPKGDGTVLGQQVRAGGTSTAALLLAEHELTPQIGANQFNALEAAVSGETVEFYGEEENFRFRLEFAA